MSTSSARAARVLLVLGSWSLGPVAAAHAARGLSAQRAQVAGPDLDALLDALRPPEWSEILAALEPAPPDQAIGRGLASDPPPVAAVGEASAELEAELAPSTSRLAAAIAAADADAVVGACRAVAGALGRRASHALSAAFLRGAVGASGGRPLDDPELLAVLTDLGRARTHAGDYKGSERLLRVALQRALERDGGPGPQAARAAWRHADALRALGDVELARTVAVEALRLCRVWFEEREPEELASAASTLARVHELLGDLPAAEPLYRQALRVRRAHHPDPSVEVAWSLNNLAVVQRKRGYWDEAEELLREAIEMQRRLRGDRDPGVGAALHNLGEVLDDKGDLEECLRVRYEALEILRRTDEDHPRTAIVMNGIAWTLRRMGRVEEAREAYGDVLERLRAAHDVEHPWVVATLEALASTSLSLSDFEAAVAHGREALELAEDLRARASEGARERALFEQELTLQPVTATLVRALVGLGEIEEALAVAERGSGRVLLDLLVGAPAGGGASTPWPSAEPASPADLRAALRPEELLLVFAECDLAECEPRSMLLVVPPSDGEPGSSELEGYVLADGETELRELRDAIERAREVLARPGGDPGPPGLLERLVPPRVAARLGPRTRLVVVPSGALEGIALEALPVADGELLIDRVAEVAYAPSGTVYRVCRETRRAVAEGPFSALVLGDPAFPDGPIRAGADGLPALPGTREEVDRVADALEAAGGRVVRLLGAQAGLARLEAEAGGTRFLHLATHGFPGTHARPYDASLALAAEDGGASGFLTLDRLLATWRARLAGCELVVLSACDTQRTVPVGSSRMGLTWGFLHAGAPTVVASLWPVDDRATQLLMTRFYENLLGAAEEPREASGRRFEPGQALPKGAALFEAKRWLRGATRREVRAAERAAPETRGAEAPADGAADADALRPYAAPYYWAGFVLIGAPD